MESEVHHPRLIGIIGSDPAFGQRVRRWTHPEAWQAMVWLFSADEGNARTESAAQITFPAKQIEDLTRLLLDQSVGGQARGLTMPQ